MDDLACRNEFENRPVGEPAKSFTLDCFLLFRQEIVVTEHLQLEHLFLSLLSLATSHFIHRVLSDQRPLRLLLPLLMHHDSLTFLLLARILSIQFILSTRLVEHFCSQVWWIRLYCFIIQFSHKFDKRV